MCIDIMPACNVNLSQFLLHNQHLQALSNHVAFAEQHLQVQHEDSIHTSFLKRLQVHLPGFCWHVTADLAVLACWQQLQQGSRL